MYKGKKIGVVVATYNGEKYVKTQLESIVNQKVKPDILVVSDGGSKDGTVNACEEYLSSADISYNIYTSDRQLGVAENFQKGLSYCDADYIFFSDQDDCWEKGKIEKTLNVFRIKDVKMVFSNALLVDDDLNSTDCSLWDFIGYKQDGMVRVYSENSESLISILLKHNIVTGMCMAISSDIKNDVMPFSQYGIHDAWVAITSNCFGRIAGLNSNLVRYRQHSGNAIGATSSIVNSYHHKDKYYDDILRRLEFIKSALITVEKHSDANAKLIYKYIDHLKSRIAYINHESGFLSIFSRKDDYLRFEYQYRQIMLKDVYTRLFGHQKNS